MNREPDAETGSLDEQIRAALAEAAPREEDRTAWVAEALARAERPGEPREGRRTARILLPLAALAAAAVLMLVASPFGGKGPGAEPGKPRAPVAAPTAEALARQRAANDEALRSEAVRKRLAAAPKGSWVGIAGGRLLSLRPTLPAVLADLRGTEHAHRYVFRAGTQGDVSYPTTFHYEVVAGTKFLADAGLALSGGPKHWNFFREEAPDRKVPGTVFPGDPRPFLAVRIGPPDRAADAGEKVVFAVSTGYGGPLILPEGLGWSAFEIPGRATVKGMFDRVDQVFRRFLVRAAIPGLGLDIVTEALGDRRDAPRPWSIGGLSWSPYRMSILAETRKKGERLLLLVGDVPGRWFLGALEADPVRKVLRGFRRAIHRVRWRAPRGLPPEDAPYARPVELVLYAPEGPGKPYRAVRRLVLTGKTTQAQVLKFLGG